MRGVVAEDIQVRAGAVTAVLTGGALRDIRVLGNRALDAVYVAVRDRDWKTVPGVLSDLQCTSRPGGFAASWSSRHRGSGIDFRWDASIAADQHGMTFRLDGVALAEFDTQRIGFCLLHPVELTGTAIDLVLADGSPAAAVFPHQVSPGPILTGAVRLSSEVGPGARLEVSFAGGSLETEDHRNWTDPGWKTYTPPQSDAAPRRMRPGERISQTVSLTGIAAAGARPRPPAAEIAELAIGEQDGVLPAVGLVLADGGEQETPSVLRMRPAVLHVDLHESDDWRSRLRQAADLAAQAGSKLSVGLIGSSPAWLASCATTLSELRQPLAAVGVYEPPEGIASQEGGRIVRQQLRRGHCGAPVGGGSRLHFAQLNRSAARDPEWDFVTFGVTAQNHHTDDDSVMSTILGQEPAVRSAIALAGGRPIAVGSVSLRPRPAPFGPASPRDLRDARESAPFGVAWLCAAVISMRAAEMITFLNPVIDGAGALPLAAGHDVERVFARLAGLAYEPVRLVRCDRRRIAALAVGPPEAEPLLILANLTPRPVTVRLAERKWTLDGYGTAMTGV
jgi:hypothetical protein